MTTSKHRETKLTVDQMEHWRKRVEAAGVTIDEQKDGRTPYISNTRTLHELVHKVSAPVLHQPRQSVLKSVHLADPSKAHNLRLKRAAVDHCLGISPIQEQVVLDEAEKRFAVQPLYIYVAPDIVVTAQDPLIIDSTQSVTIYGHVQIVAGGYIQISVPCHFQCQVLQKVSPQHASSVIDADYDFILRGKDGPAGNNGEAGALGTTGGGGARAECDLAGGCVQSEGKSGGNGGNASNGNDGYDGFNGEDSPSVIISIGDLQSTVTLFNVGGSGGTGGRGGTGGKGGRGGSGGKDTICWACQASGGNGGNGGDGGSGGNGGNGGNGGSGGYSIAYYATGNSSAVLVTNGQSSGGEFGQGGASGPGGDPGAGGGRNASGGQSGNAGKPGNRGYKGNPGAAGNVDINPRTLQETH
jgi:hypothetical protein